VKIELPSAFIELDKRIRADSFVRAVLSGRRRNMQTEYERIDIRQVLIKDEIKWQIISSDGKKDITKMWLQILTLLNYLKVDTPTY